MDWVGLSVGQLVHCYPQKLCKNCSYEKWLQVHNTARYTDLMPFNPSSCHAWCFLLEESCQYMQVTNTAQINKNGSNSKQCRNDGFTASLPTQSSLYRLLIIDYFVLCSVSRNCTYDRYHPVLIDDVETIYTPNRSTRMLW